MRNDFRGKKSKLEESWYDLEYDRELIIQSIAKQYHILPSEQEELHYRDWYELLSGLMHDTPLGQVVRIRCEDNKDIIKNFSAYEKSLRAEWRAFQSSRKAKNYSTNDKINVGNYFEKLFSGMFGGEK